MIYQSCSRFLLVTMIVGLPACTVGPDFIKPKNTIQEEQWRSARQDVNSVPIETTINKQWWQLFNDPIMSFLIERAVSSNLDIKMAVSRLSQSRAIGKVVGSDQYPNLGMGLDYSRQRRSQKGLNDPSGNSGKESFNLWDFGLSIAWELDLWGKIRRQVEVANANIEMAENDQYAVQLAIIAETANNYIELRGVQATLEITKQNLDIANKALKLSKIRFEEGVSTQLDISQAATQVASTQAQIPVLEARQIELINTLSLLLAEPPYQLQKELILKKDIPNPPHVLPVGLPSELAERRPDIRQVSATLHAATANIGVAKANFYPSINLLGNLGTEAYNFTRLGHWDAHQFNIGPSIYLPIFEGGRLTGTLELKEEQAKEAAINYQKVVLQAWHEVENSLVSFQANQQQRTSLDEAVLHSREALKYAGQQYKEGTIDYLHVLTTQQALLENQQKQIASTTAVSLTMVGIYKALGGGWSINN